MDGHWTWEEDKEKRNGSWKKAWTFGVSDRNSGKDYEHFCSEIEGIAKRIGKHPDETEWLLMSEGGRGRRKPDSWRQHIIDYRVPPI